MEIIFIVKAEELTLSSTIISASKLPSLGSYLDRSMTFMATSCPVAMCFPFLTIENPGGRQLPGSTRLISWHFRTHLFIITLVVQAWKSMSLMKFECKLLRHLYRPTFDQLHREVKSYIVIGISSQESLAHWKWSLYSDLPKKLLPSLQFWQLHSFFEQEICIIYSILALKLIIEVHSFSSQSGPSLCAVHWQIIWSIPSRDRYNKTWRLTSHTDGFLHFVQLVELLFGDFFEIRVFLEFIDTIFSPAGRPRALARLQKSPKTVANIPVLGRRCRRGEARDWHGF